MKRIIVLLAVAALATALTVPALAKTAAPAGNGNVAR
jgi:hypothetical protein